MQALMDRVEFTSQPETTGSIVHLVKTLAIEPASPLRRLPSIEVPRLY
jgi:hypothetical protein